MLHCAVPYLSANRSWFAPLRLALPCGALHRRVKGFAQIRNGKRVVEGLGVGRSFRRECKRAWFAGKKRERLELIAGACGATRRTSARVGMFASRMPFSQLSKNDSSLPSEKKPFYIIPDPIGGVGMVE